MLRNQLTTVHVDAQWPLEVLHIGGAVAFRANLLLAAEVNTKKSRHRHHWLCRSIALTDLHTELQSVLIFEWRQTFWSHCIETWEMGSK